MSDFASVLPSVSLLKPAAALGATPQGSSAAKIKAVAKQFEASFIGAMLQPMFAGLSTAAPFGGGEGEGAFRSFLTDAMAKQMAKNGGIGLAPAIEREMLKMQSVNGGAGAAEPPVAATAAQAYGAASAAAAAAPAKLPTKLEDAA